MKSRDGSTTWVNGSQGWAGLGAHLTDTGSGFVGAPHNPMRSRHDASLPRRACFDDAATRQHFSEASRGGRLSAVVELTLHGGSSPMGSQANRLTG